MVEICDTTVFNCDVDAITNTINCVGVMGAGLALEFRLRFPCMYQDYQKRCNEGLVVPGQPYLYAKSTPMIVNFPTKQHWKNPAKREWIEQGLEMLVRKSSVWGVESLALPPLGTSLGGLDFCDIRDLMDKYLASMSIPVYICLDRTREAEGLEKEMLDKLHAMTAEELLQVGIRKENIRKSIQSNLPLDRFRHLLDLEGVGKKTYEKLFTQICKWLEGNSNGVRQISLLEDSEQV